MRKKLLPILSLILALTVLVALVAPIFAHQAPAGADSNALQLTIGRLPGGVLNIGDEVNYTVTVRNQTSAELGPVPPNEPCYQSSIDTTFTDPNKPIGNVQTFPQIPGLLPGEFVTFNSAGFTAYEYDPATSTPSGISRALLISGNASMPDTIGLTALPANVMPGTVTVINPHSYPLLDYVIKAGDLVFVGGQYQVTASSHTGNVLGAHDSVGTNDSGNATKDITVTIGGPNTTTTITSAVSAVDYGQGTTLTVTENNTGGIPLTSPHVQLSGGSSLDLVWNDLYFVDSTDPASPGTQGVLDVGETWEWDNVPTGALNSTTIFTATGHGTDPNFGDITYDNEYFTERDSVTVNVNSPGTIVGVSASSNANNLPPSGGNVDLTFTEFNSGTIPLNHVSVTILQNGNPASFSPLTAPPTSGDPANPGTQGVLDPGETWSWTVSNVLITATTTFTVTGYGDYGTDPVIPVTFPDVDSERTSLTIVVPPPQQTPASSDWSIGLLIAGFVGLMVFFGFRRMRRSQS